MSEQRFADPSDVDVRIGEWEVSRPHERRGRGVISKVFDDRAGPG
jgi:hypothetical protein